MLSFFLFDDFKFSREIIHFFNLCVIKTSQLINRKIITECIVCFFQLVKHKSFLEVVQFFLFISLIFWFVGNFVTHKTLFLKQTIFV